MNNLKRSGQKQFKKTNPLILFTFPETNNNEQEGLLWKDLLYLNYLLSYQ